MSCVRSVLFVMYCLFGVVRCWLFFVVRCVWFGVYCLLSLVCWLLCVVCYRVLFVDSLCLVFSGCCFVFLIVFPVGCVRCVCVSRVACFFLSLRGACRSLFVFCCAL